MAGKLKTVVKLRGASVQRMFELQSGTEVEEFRRRVPVKSWGIRGAAVEAEEERCVGGGRETNRKINTGGRGGQTGVEEVEQCWFNPRRTVINHPRPPPLRPNGRSGGGGVGRMGEVMQLRYTWNLWSALDTTPKVQLGPLDPGYCMYAQTWSADRQPLLWSTSVNIYMMYGMVCHIMNDGSNLSSSSQQVPPCQFLIPKD